MANVSQYFPNREYLIYANVPHQGRPIVRCQRNEEVSLELVQQALSNLSRNYHCIFPSEASEMRMQIEQKKFLVLNGRIACLTEKNGIGDPPDETIKDMYFSGCIINEPTNCVNGHALERQMAVAWRAIHGNRCPAPDCNGELGPLDINLLLQGNIRIHLEQQQALDRLANGPGNLIATQATHFEQEIRNLQAILESYENKYGDLCVTLPVALLKESVKLGGKDASKAIAKAFTRRKLGVQTAELVTKKIGEGMTREAAEQFAKMSLEKGAQETLKASGKKGAQSAAKYIPLVSCVVAVGMCGYRIYFAKEKADYVKGVAELVSGVAALVPVYGTTLSITIDIGIAGHDLWSGISRDRNNNTENVVLDEDYRILGVTRNNLLQNPPTRQEIDANYQRLTVFLHPNNRVQLTQELLNSINPLFIKITAIRDKIYRLRGWQ